MDKKIRGLIISFKYAFRGLAYCVGGERNLRIHMVVAGYVAYFSSFYELAKGQVAILMVSISLVIICEMLNTAIEALVDRVAPTYDSMARIAKDVAAGAVLVSALFSILVGWILLWDVPTIGLIAISIVVSPVSLFTHATALAASVYFIFYGYRDIVAPIKRWLKRT